MRSGLVVVSVTAGGRFINIWPSELDFLTRSISNNWVGGGQGEGGDQSNTYWVVAELFNTPNILEGGNCGWWAGSGIWKWAPCGLGWHPADWSGKESCCLTATGKFSNLKYLFLELEHLSFNTPNILQGGWEWWKPGGRPCSLQCSWPEYESFVGAGAVENEGEGQVHQGLDIDQSGEATLLASFIMLNLLIIWIG